MNFGGPPPRRGLGFVPRIYSDAGFRALCIKALNLRAANKQLTTRKDKKEAFTQQTKTKFHFSVIAGLKAMRLI